MATPDNLTEEAFETLYAVPALTVSHAHMQEPVLA